MVTQIEDTRPIPFAVGVLQMTLTDLRNAADAFSRDAMAFHLTNDPDGDTVAEACFDLATDELERWEAKKAAREARKAARMRAEAGAWPAAGTAETGR